VRANQPIAPMTKTSEACEGSPPSASSGATKPDGPSPGTARRPRRQSRSEATHLRPAIVAVEDVLWPKVPAHDAGSVQVGEGCEEGGKSSDGLPRSQRPPGAEKVGQAPADDLVENQSQRAVGEGDGVALSNQMLVVDRAKGGHQVSGLRKRLAEVGNPDDLDQEPSIVMGANC
jgi:hypothetical protein